VAKQGSITSRKEMMLMQWLTPDFEEFDCAGEVTMYVYHW
jgi:coenzyme PQQ precursor peptide PqqA